MNWKECTIGDVMTLKRGHDLPERNRIAGDVPIVSSSGISGFHSESKVDAPGVVTGRYGTLGEVYFIQQAYWPLNTALYVTDFKGNDPRFIAYFLRNVIRNYRSDKAAVPGIDRNVLHRLTVRLPDDRSIQENIASILSTYDDLIENNSRRIALLEQSARELYCEWFMRRRFPGHERTKPANGLPEGWERKQMSDVCDTVGGGTPSTKVDSYWNGDVTWVVPTDVTKSDCLVLLDSTRKITERGLRESSAKLVPAETILMTSRASVGFFALMSHEVCTNQGFINAIPKNEQFRMYLLFNLMSRVAEIRSNAKGSTYPEISKGRFRKLNIVVPTENLVIEFSNIAYDVIRQVRNLKHLTHKLSEARELLLPRLMSGELTVRQLQ